MSEPNHLSNPYHLSDSAKHGRLFFGRRHILDWIQTHVEQDPLSIRLLVINGEAHIGKTALLRQIEHYNDLLDKQLTVYLDFNQIPATSLSHFLYSAVTQIIAHPEIQEKLASIELTQTDFVANPFETFAHHLIQIQYVLPGRNILLLGDNVDQIWQQLGDVRQSTSFLDEFNQALLATTAVWCVVTTKTQPEIPVSSGSSLTRTTLGPLTLEETTQFVRQPVPFTVVKEVVEYIHHLTEGKPVQLHALCHAIFEYQQEKGIKLITISDITHMLKSAESPFQNEWQGSDLTFGQPLRPILRPIPWPKTHLRWAGAAGILLLLVLLGSFTNAFALFRPSDPPTAVAQQTPAPDATNPLSGFSNQESTATAVASATPTMTATETSTSVPSPTSTPTSTPTPTPSPTLTRTPLAYPVAITRTTDNMPMQLIPAGTFLMGSKEEDFLASSDEIPQREVTVSQFYMDQYEVSVAQYSGFLNRLGRYREACNFHDCALPRLVVGYTSYLDQQELVENESQFTPLLGFSNYPINHVSWFGAKSYCEAMGARLPTEAEWEYAARGSDGRLYPWGNEAPDDTYAVFNSSSFENLKPVDALPKGVSPFGLYNMAGSMWEWTADWYDETYYQNAPDINPTGPENGLARVIRGGAWPFNNQAERLRTANRNQLTPDFISSTVGFRCVQDP